MNDFVIFGMTFVAVLAVILFFGFYSLYRGVHDTLTNPTLGAVYNFRYFQPVTGTYERYLAKVVRVAKLTQYEINKLNWHSNYRVGDENFQRSNTLVTCLMADGEYRNFYAERSDMCRRSPIAGLLFRVGVAHLF